MKMTIQMNNTQIQVL